MKKSIFVDTTATREYTLSAEPSIVWTIGALDSLLVLHILGKMYGTDAPDSEKYFAQLADFVRFGLRSARDAETGEAIDIPFEDVDVPFIGKRRALAGDFLGRIRPDFLMELGREIRSDNLLTDEERKNSSGLYQSPATPD